MKICFEYTKILFPTGEDIGTHYEDFNDIGEEDLYQYVKILLKIMKSNVAWREDTKI